MCIRDRPIRRRKRRRLTMTTDCWRCTVRRVCRGLRSTLCAFLLSVGCSKAERTELAPPHPKASAQGAVVLSTTPPSVVAPLSTTPNPAVTASTPPGSRQPSSVAPSSGGASPIASQTSASTSPLTGLFQGLSSPPDRVAPPRSGGSAESRTPRFRASLLCLIPRYTARVALGDTGVASHVSSPHRLMLRKRAPNPAGGSGSGTRPRVPMVLWLHT